MNTKNHQAHERQAAPCVVPACPEKTFFRVCKSCQETLLRENLRRVAADLYN